MVMASGEAGTATLEVWRDEGASVVVVPASLRHALESMVRAASELRPPRTREEDRPEPLVPAVRAAHDAHDDDDDI
jgi:hypothetical protein